MKTFTTKENNVIEEYCKKTGNSRELAEFLIISRQGKKKRALQWHKEHPNFIGAWTAHILVMAGMGI